MGSRYVALLRGVNVSGKHTLPMAELRGLFEELGCKRVETYIQSGNVAFDAGAKLATQSALSVSKRIHAAHGFRVPVLVRSRKQLCDAVAANPYLAEGCETHTLHLGFLADRPSKQAIDSLDPARSTTDRFEVIGQEVHLHLPHGIGRSKLTSDYFERRLRTTITVRNWRTVQKLIAMTE